MFPLFPDDFEDPVTSFRRQEIASVPVAKAKFPSLLNSEEKRVRFIVVHGLEIVERPQSLSAEDSDWSFLLSPILLDYLSCTSPYFCFFFVCRFKRVTGRREVSVSSLDFEFYSSRTKLRRGFCSFEDAMREKVSIFTSPTHCILWFVVFILHFMFSLISAKILSCSLSGYTNSSTFLPIAVPK